ncbi:phospholipase A2 inhibitor-like [Lingula anatina]|uniref:Phospholipase A2 inhibitor-like n=1 Tax=Lingula anatina TaxID=7574 RepID=A0A1S3JHQ7_LINAN|nr:phospholipase A2 inhibitor-like [Lingula anatina]|eukprot:XP_013409666.1 phospholipase A2 inhibitor-like [Lingula anatina]
MATAAVSTLLLMMILPALAVNPLPDTRGDWRQDRNPKPEPKFYPQFIHTVGNSASTVPKYKYGVLFSEKPQHHQKNLKPTFSHHHRTPTGKDGELIGKAAESVLKFSEATPDQTGGTHIRQRPGYAVPVHGVQCPQVCRCDFHTGMTNCSREGLEQIPSGIPPNTTQLELANNNLVDLPDMAFSDLFQLQEIGLSGNYLNLSSFHVSTFKTKNPTLTTLDLMGSNLPEVPPYLPHSLTYLYLIQCGVRTLRNESFLGTPLLEHLDLSNNQITELPGGVFKPLSRLQVLYISFNQILCVPEGLFWGNQMLSILSLRFNQLKEIPKGAEMYPLRIEHLDFVGNPITTVPARVFENLTQLQTLEIWQCSSLTTIEDYAFSGLGNLQILDLNECNISNGITNKTFQGLTTLWELYVYGNKIRSMEAGGLLPMKALSSLWLQDNKFSTLEEGSISKVTNPKLSEVFLEFNPWICDCHLRWLREQMDRGNFTIMDPHLIVCSGPEHIKGKAWDQLKPSDFVCT